MLEPLKRSGGRRYYRPEDVQLVERIDYLVNDQGYTLKGAKQVIEQGDETPLESVTAAEPPAVAEQTEPSGEMEGSPVEPSHESQPVIGDAPIADDGGLASFFGTPEGEAVAEVAPAEPSVPTPDPVAVPAAEPAEQAETVAPSLTREDIIARLKQIHGTLAEAVRA
jgi:DNA-binding transcriptional MerR regulator